MIFKNFKHFTFRKNTIFAADIFSRNELKNQRNEETFHYVGSHVLSDVHRL